MNFIRLAGIVAVICGHLALVAAQSFDAVPLWLAELTRFVPYYWVLLPSLAAVVLALGLSWWVGLVAVGNVALLLTVTMGLQWNSPDADAAVGTRVRVLTYNVKLWSARRQAADRLEIDREVRSHAPDIVALQDGPGFSPFASEATPTPSPPLFGLPHVVALGQYVLASRYPLQACDTGQIGVRDEPHAYLRCQVQIGGKRVQLITVHFVSPRQGLMAARHGLTDGIQAWAENLNFRLWQSGVVLKDLVKTPGSVILMGDLNATESSPVVGQLKRAGLRNTFSQAGRGWGFTHGHSLSRETDFIRIDHILTSADMTAVRSYVGGSSASEHNPVIADVVLQP